MINFEEYRTFKTKRAKQAWQTRKADDSATAVTEAEVTPDERLDAAYNELRETLADDLLDRVRSSSPKFFEHLVVDLLVAMGYGGHSHLQRKLWAGAATAASTA